MKDQQPVHVFATWKVKPGYIQEVLEILHNVGTESRQESGNLFYNIHQGISDENTLVLFEGYKDEAAVSAHRDSAHFQELVLKKIVPLLDSRDVLVTHPIGAGSY